MTKKASTGTTPGPDAFPDSKVGVWSEIGKLRRVMGRMSVELISALAAKPTLRGLLCGQTQPTKP